MSEQPKPTLAAYLPFDPAQASPPPRYRNFRRRRVSDYVPPWTDPRWQDEGPDRQRTNFPISDGTFDRLRPALLPGDDQLRPTKYARRFGIFPDRQDGRSQTSPTRSSTKQIFTQGRVKTGENLFHYFEEWAELGEKHVDDYFKEDRPDLETHATDDHMRFVQAYEELTIEEFWQAIMLGDMTMDELLAGDHFCMGDAQSDISGLHPLLKREKWVVQDLIRKRPVMKYDIDGHQGQFDGQDDRVWAAILPSLLLASKFLQYGNVFFTALMDPRSKSAIDDSEDLRSADAKRIEGPLHRVRLNPRFADTVVSKITAKCSPTLDMGGLTAKVLDRMLRWHIDTAAFGIREVRDPEAAAGLALSRKDDCGEKQPIRIFIAAELIVPLLDSRYSDSEKTMMSYVIASTIVHEFSHAIEMAQKRWLFTPKTFGITKTTDMKFARELREKLYSGESTYQEPLFADDAGQELGFAFEEHLLGGSTWPVMNANPIITVEFLRWYAGIANVIKFPSDRWARSVKRKPGTTVWKDAYMFVTRHKPIHGFFRQDFWEVNVGKYGMSAVRETDTDPWPTNSCPVLPYSSTIELRRLGLHTIEDRRYITGVIDHFHNAGKYSISAYLAALCHDSYAFCVLCGFMATDVSMWYNRSIHIRKVCNAIIIKASEAVLHASHRDPSLTIMQRARLETWARRRHRAVLAGEVNYDFLDSFTKSCGPTSSADFLANVQNLPDLFGEMIYRRMTRLMTLLKDEQRILESHVCKLYSLPSQYWERYEVVLPGHREAMMARAIRFGCNIRMVVEALTEVHALKPAYVNSWPDKLRSLATHFDNIAALLRRDNSSISKRWRSVLMSVPLLRKSCRAPADRMFWLAKKEMLRLKPKDVKLLRQFAEKAQELFDIPPYKFCFRDDDKQKQRVSERWAGLLDGVVLTEQEAKDRMAQYHAYTVEHSSEITDLKGLSRKADVRAEQEAQAYKPTKRALENIYYHGKRETRVADVAARTQSGVAFRTTHTNVPQITSTRVQGHPRPLTSLQRPVSLRVTKSRSSSQHAPALDTLRLAAAVNQPASNRFARAGRHGLLKRRSVTVSLDALRTIGDSMAAALEECSSRPPTADERVAIHDAFRREAEARFDAHNDALEGIKARRREAQLRGYEAELAAEKEDDKNNREELTLDETDSDAGPCLKRMGPPLIGRKKRRRFERFDEVSDNEISLD